MSIEFRDAIWASTLPPDEKFLALALIKFAARDGSRIFPSQKLLAQMVGKKERAVRVTMKKLRERRIFEAVSGEHGGLAPGGKGITVRYQFHPENLPMPAGYSTAAFDGGNPAVSDAERGSHLAGTRQRGSGDPATEPTKEANKELDGELATARDSYSFEFSRNKNSYPHPSPPRPVVPGANRVALANELLRRGIRPVEWDSGSESM